MLQDGVANQKKQAPNHFYNSRIQYIHCIANSLALQKIYIISQQRCSIKFVFRLISPFWQLGKRPCLYRQIYFRHIHDSPCAGYREANPKGTCWNRSLHGTICKYMNECYANRNRKNIIRFSTKGPMTLFYEMDVGTTRSTQTAQHSRTWERLMSDVADAKTHILSDVAPLQRILLIHSLRFYRQNMPGQNGPLGILSRLLWYWHTFTNNAANRSPQNRST